MRLLLTFIFLSFCFVSTIQAQVSLNARKKVQRSKKTPEIVVKPEYNPISESNQFKIEGIVLDSLNSEPLLGATITILNSNSGTYTDQDGKFSIQTSSEIVNIQITYTGYNTKILQNIQLKKGYSLRFNVTLSDKINEEVLVVSTIDRETDAAAFMVQLNTLQIKDVYANESMLKTASNLNLENGLNRLNGVVLLDEKQLVIRGLMDRFNLVTLNGVPMNTSGLDLTNFDMSKFPIVLVSQMRLSKSAGAEELMNFSGGKIELETQGIPESKKLKILVQGNFNDRSTFKTILTHPAGNQMQMMFNTKGVLPESFPTASYFQSHQATDPEVFEAAKQVKQWTYANSKTAQPGGGLAINYGNQWKISENQKFGLVTGAFIHSSNARKSRELKVTRSFDQDLGTFPITDFGTYETYNTQASLNGILNLFYIKNKSKFQFLNTFIANSNSEVTVNYGKYIVDQSTNDFGYYSFYPVLNQSKKSFISQLSAQHSLKNNNAVEWLVFASSSKLFLPGNRAMNYLIQDSTNQYLYDITLADEYEQFASIFTAVQKDKSIGAKADWSHHFSSTQWISSIKGGIWIDYQFTNFNSREFGFYQDPDSFHLDLSTLNENNPKDIFIADHLGSGMFIFKDKSTNFNNYQAVSSTHAAYWSSDFVLGALHIRAGLRLENFSQKIQIQHLDNSNSLFYTSKNLLLLPSVHSKWEIRSNSALKFAYFRSVFRPTSREIVPFNYYSYSYSAGYLGNPNLISGFSDNIDLRMELLPATKTLFSLGVFSKWLKNPVEANMREGSISVIQQNELRNIHKAGVIGVELECRINGSSILNLGVLKNFWFYMNGSLMKSRAHWQLSQYFAPDLGNNRPLQGQPNTMLNTGIYYSSDKSGIETGLFLNHVGTKIAIVGVDQSIFPNIWDAARTTLDYQFSWKFNKNLSIKLILQDLLNQPYIRMQSNGTQGEKPNIKSATHLMKIKNGFQSNISLNFNF